MRNSAEISPCRYPFTLSLGKKASLISALVTAWGGWALIRETREVLERRYNRVDPNSSKIPQNIRKVSASPPVAHAQPWASFCFYFYFLEHYKIQFKELSSSIKIIFQLEAMIKLSHVPHSGVLDDFSLFPAPSLSLFFLSFQLSVCALCSVCVCVFGVFGVTAAPMNSWEEIRCAFSSLVITLIHRKCLLQSARAMWDRKSVV